MDGELKETLKKRQVLFWTAGVFILIGLGIGLYFGLNQNQAMKPSGPVEKVTIADGTSANSAPLYVALNKGYFKREELDVSLQIFRSGKEALEALIVRKADLAFAADTPVMFGIMGGDKVSIVATVFETVKLHAIVARKDRGISKPGDLSNKRIGVTKGTSGQFFLDNFFVFNRIRREEVRIIFLQPDEMLRFLREGRVDAVSVWDPYGKRLQEELGTNGISFRYEVVDRMFWNAVAIQDFVKKNPASVTKILRGLIRGVGFIREQPDEARRIVASTLKMDELQMAEFWNTSNFGVTLPPTLIINLEDQARWAIKNKLTDNKSVPNFLNYIYFDALRAVEPGAVTIVH